MFFLPHPGFSLPSPSITAVLLGPGEATHSELLGTKGAEHRLCNEDQMIRLITWWETCQSVVLSTDCAMKTRWSGLSPGGKRVSLWCWAQIVQWRPDDQAYHLVGNVSVCGAEHRLCNEDQMIRLITWWETCQSVVLSTDCAMKTRWSGLSPGGKRVSLWCWAQIVQWRPDDQAYHLVGNMSVCGAEHRLCNEDQMIRLITWWETCQSVVLSTDCAMKTRWSGLSPGGKRVSLCDGVSWAVRGRKLDIISFFPGCFQMKLDLSNLAWLPVLSFACLYDFWFPACGVVQMHKQAPFVEIHNCERFSLFEHRSKYSFTCFTYCQGFCLSNFCLSLFNFFFCFLLNPPPPPPPPQPLQSWGNT